jgi:hypothetical protein
LKVKEEEWEEKSCVFSPMPHGLSVLFVARRLKPASGKNLSLKIALRVISALLTPTELKLPWGGYALRHAIMPSLKCRREKAPTFALYLSLVDSSRYS